MDPIVAIILVVFALALVAGLVRKFRKDPCLAKFGGFHASYLGADGTALWGDMVVTSQGIELLFDAPHRDERGLEESGAILFGPEMSSMIAVARSVHGMTDAERAKWKQHVDETLRPGRWLRAKRWLANVGGMVRDAVVDTLGVLLGQLGAKNKRAAALADREKQVSQIGGAVLDLGARAYEPLLERHVGRAVILGIELPGEDEHRKLYFPGYLGEYNEKFLVLVNESHAPEESVVVAANSEDEGACARVSLRDERLEIAACGDDAIVVKRLVGASDSIDVSAVLLADCRIDMHLPAEFGFRHAEIDRTRRIDLVCPRARAQVQFSSTRPPLERSPWNGIGPG